MGQTFYVTGRFLLLVQEVWNMLPTSLRLIDIRAVGVCVEGKQFD